MPRPTIGVLIVLTGLGVLAGVLAAPAAAAMPTVSSFSPTSGGLGRAVVITGSGFTSTSTVAFGASAFTAASFTSSTQITAKVPAGATTGVIRVATPGSGTGASSTSFTVTPSLSIAPAAAPPGGSVTVSGAGFGAFEGVDVYLGTQDLALATTNGGGLFSAPVSVPASQPPGTAWLTAVGRHSGSAAQKPLTIRSNWLQFQGSPNHSGSDTRENLLNIDTVTGLDTNWDFTASGGLDSPPAVANGVAFFDDSAGNVYAINVNTGNQLWSRALGGQFFSSPAVSGTTVYLADYGFGNGVVYALNTATGATLWSDTLYALTASNGTVAWKDTLGAPAFYTPVVAGGRVFVGTQNGTFYADTAATGAALWSTDFGEGGVSCAASVVAGTVYLCTSDGVLHALNTSTGSERWQFTAASSLGELSPASIAPAVADNTVYFGDDSGDVYSLNATTGNQNWTYNIGANAGAPIVGAPIVANGVIYIGDASENVYAFAYYGGTPLWQGTTGGGTTPIVNDGRLIVTSSDGTLYDYAPASTPSAAPAPPRPARLQPNHHLHAVTLR
jgi:outer membrane protein assembly factor BamB